MYKVYAFIVQNSPLISQVFDIPSVLEFYLSLYGYLFTLIYLHVICGHCTSWSLCYGASRVLPRNRDGDFCRRH